MKAFSPTLLAAATILGAVPVLAQQTATATPQLTCEIEQGKPQALARATLSLTRATAVVKSGDPTKDLKDVVATLNAPTLKNDNPVGRAFVLGG